uniref:Uncharacterized protein n=1 Tax=Moniliophthora roreri TaxID=221103 RepID=A0A0W0F6T2_MONRR
MLHAVCQYAIGKNGNCFVLFDRGSM